MDKKRVFRILNIGLYDFKFTRCTNPSLTDGDAFKLVLFTNDTRSSLRTYHDYLTLPIVFLSVCHIAISLKQSMIYCMK